MRKAVYIIAIIFVAAVSYRLGVYVTMEAMSNASERMKAELNFSHYQNYKSIKTDFLKDCNKAVAARLDQIIEEQKMAMAEFVHRYHDQEFNEYVIKREPDLIEELEDYDVDWNKEWIIPGCE